MGIDDQTVQILMDLLSRIDTRMGVLDEKLTSKLENALQNMREEVVEIRTYQTRLEARCESRKAQSEGFHDRLETVEKEVGSLKIDVRDLKLADERNEWKIFFKMNGKLALFITTIGTAVMLLYQIYMALVVNKPDTPIPSAPSVVQPTP